MEANCYLVEWYFNGELCYIIIDPCVDYKIMKSLSKGKIKGVLITHGHFDHFEKLQGYLENSDVEIYMSYYGKEKLEDSVKNCSKMMGNDLSFIVNDRFKFVRNSDAINICGKMINIIENSGHSSCSISFIIDDMMFSGDFIFKGSIGRYDLFSASEKEMKKSLEKFKLNKNNYVIYPGHGESTTFDEEIKNNRYLQ